MKEMERLYENNYIRIKNRNALSELILVNKGLRQGYRLSPTLFKFYLDQS
jgi:hypothetical protein